MVGGGGVVGWGAEGGRGGIDLNCDRETRPP